MILQLRHGKTLYEVHVPRGSQVQRNAIGLPMLIVPGPRPQDTASWVGAPEIVGAARRGQYGMSFRSERRLAACV
ncbi:hypothetical protein AB1L88_01465 [Tautonia sp. JC769]|uniref:hypothetical protein n=1 Tax=Tautonia sp. JC769 TaxID=3232135 RepID=UPI003459CB4E